MELVNGTMAPSKKAKMFGFRQLLQIEEFGTREYDQCKNI